MNVLGSISHTADVYNGAGEDDVHTVLFGGGVCGQSQLQDLIAVQVGLGSDLKERGSDFGCHKGSTLFPVYSFSIITACLCFVNIIFFRNFISAILYDL
jgi:hypothetical protein